MSLSPPFIFPLSVSDKSTSSLAELTATFVSVNSFLPLSSCSFAMAAAQKNISLLLILLLLSFFLLAAGRRSNQGLIRMPTDHHEEEKAEAAAAEQEDDEVIGTTRWAVLVAGSNGYGNYRHQADVCHAYQILRNGGIKEENIIVFMYDDIAHNDLNPRPGIIINHPQGQDVYAAVPKDYTGEHVTAANLYAVLLGNKTALSGGSGKVVDSNSNDRIFLYYSDHGGPGVLGMPNMPYLYAMDFIEVLKKKHAAKGYKEMVIYVEACESGSIFEGIMPKDIDVYVTTASNAQESSWGTYCPGMVPPPPPEYITCLGDLYSVAWMEDSETHNLKRETVKQQYEAVRSRTSNLNTYNGGSHVMEYGNVSIKGDRLYMFQGFDPATVNLPPHDQLNFRPFTEAVNQRDADLLFLWHKYKRADDKSEKKSEVLKEFTETMSHRIHLDGSIDLIGTILFGPGKASTILKSSRQPGVPLVDDWECLKSMVRVFETHCGSLTQYGMKHMRAFANICNGGVSVEEMEEASSGACQDYRSAQQWHPSNRGYSA